MPIPEPITVIRKMRDDIDNGMLRETPRELEDVEMLKRQQRCYAMHLDEFLDALEIGSHKHVSRGEGEVALGAVVCGLLGDEVSIADLIEVVRKRSDVGLWLARRYAEQELAHYVDEGSL